MSAWLPPLDVIHAPLAASRTDAAAPTRRRPVPVQRSSSVSRQGVEAWHSCRRLKGALNGRLDTKRATRYM
jgi:hypothetical protein